MRKKFFNNTIVFILLLTFTAGYANILSIYTVGTPSTHMTGSLTNISYSLFELDMKRSLLLFSFILLFLLGGAISGYIFSNRQFGRGKSYGVLLIIVGIILAIVETTIANRYIVTAIVVILSGTQNGLNITYNEITIRTTHMTGYLSDIGRLVGLKLGGKKIEEGKLAYLILAVFMYFLGGVVAIFLSLPNHGHNFYEISILYIVAGIFYLNFIYNKEVSEEIKKYSK
ncbi:YoaK family protein [Miniphocaeibacter massiliensis]|uniref:YoaK family protein n=1 Tax=Miniphocaeibacter massiliensis TaxID=2041841 RepID=UPI000C1BA947|nr:YoaK family protein [Miniphocaeibacter massiliensis]